MMAANHARKRIVALAALASAIDGFDLQSMGLAVPLMARQHGVPPTAYGPALTATVVGMIVGALVLTPLSDRFGQRRMLITAMLLVASGSLMTAVADTLPLLTGVRLLVGVGIGCAVPVAVSLVSNNVGPAHRTTLVTAVVVATGIGSFLAGMTAPPIVANGGWRAIFAVGAVMPIASALLLWIALPGTIDAPARTSEGTFFAVQRLFEIENRRATVVLWLVMPMNLLVTYALIAWLPTLMIGAGWATATAQRATGLLAIGGIIGGVGLGALADRGWLKSMLVLAHLCAAVAFLTMGFGQVSWWLLLVIAVGLTSFGASLMLGAATPQFYATPIRATGTGWASGVGRLGAVLGPLVVTVALGKGLAPQFTLMLLAAPSAFCAAVAMLLPPILRRSNFAQPASPTGSPKTVSEE